ncbi:hypothetical protein [Klebsiella pneumoniae]
MERLSGQLQRLSPVAAS